VLGSSAPGTKFQRVTKASALSKRTDQAGDRSRALQCPNKALVPNAGQCGRRERESRREGRREQSLRDNNSFACRGGGRHPGFPEGGALRGAPPERRPRSVRTSWRVSPRQDAAPMTTDVRKEPRRGTSSACATKCRHRTMQELLHIVRGRVLRLVFRPVHVNPRYAPGAQASSGGAVDLASRLGKPTEVGITNTGVERTDGARLAAGHSLLQGRGRGPSRKGRRSRSPSLRGSRVRVELPAHR